MLRTILIFPFWLIIKIYQYLISPLTPAACRHLPTCSSYTLEALKRYGAITGLKLGTNRILRCHPWGTHGFDPVPKLVIKKMKLGNWPQYDVLKEKMLFERNSNSPNNQE